MALSFPRAMPSEGAERSTFEIARVDFGTPETGGRMGSVSAGFPLWRMTLELGLMDRPAADAWRAFIASLRGSLRTFYARDLIRPYPLAHPGGLAGFDGAADDWSVGGTRDVLTLQLPSAGDGLTLGLGDLVGFSWDGDRRTAVRVVEAGVEAGGEITVSIEPPLPTVVPSDAVASVYQAEVVMRLLPAETTVGSEDPIETQGGRIVAVQDLRA